jgi:hypothetical protein
MVHTATFVVVSMVGMLAAALILLVAQVQMVMTVDRNTVRFDRSTGHLVQCESANARPVLWWVGAGRNCADQ